MRRRMVIGAGLALAVPARAAPIPLRIGLLHTLSPAPLYIAMERGYFADEGLAAEFKFFEAAQPIAAAAVSRDIDIGITALTGGFFSLAGRGVLKVIGGGLHERPGVQGTGLIASRQAFAAGLTGPGQLAGRSVGITQYGSSFHYIVGRLAEREGFDMSRVTLRPLQSIGNMLAALRTGQVDATLNVASQIRPLVESGEAHLLGWIGDLVPYQITALFAPTATVQEQPDTVHRFARAYRRAVDEYRAAFFQGGDPAPLIPLIQKYVFTSDPDAARKIGADAGWYDPGARLDAADVAAQLRWFTAQGLVKTQANPAELIDDRFLGTE